MQTFKHYMSLLEFPHLSSGFDLHIELIKDDSKNGLIEHFLWVIKKYKITPEYLYEAIKHDWGAGIIDLQEFIEKRYNVSVEEIIEGIKEKHDSKKP
jgi:hypothetical protein